VIKNKKKKNDVDHGAGFLQPTMPMEMGTRIQENKAGNTNNAAQVVKKQQFNPLCVCMSAQGVCVTRGQGAAPLRQ
jgi:hypothetical protein